MLCFAVLGFLYISEPNCLDSGSEDFLARMRENRRRTFGALRADANAAGHLEVCRFLQGQAKCREVLRMLVDPAPGGGRQGGSEGASAPAAGLQLRRSGAFGPLRLLTWNVCGEMHSQHAPGDRKA